MTSFSRQLGNQGELFAKSFLEQKGLFFVEQNFYSKGGEIDLIFFDSKKQEYVFVEVKTRTSVAFGFPHEAVTSQKFQKMLLAIEAFFFQKMQFSEMPFFRVDIVSVFVDHDAFFCDHREGIGFDDFSL